ncbi:MAG TPA: hypothetical protein VLH38_05740 [Patescibacteria group bacterium]|nr:hypothetical protein [Patescibacteria group bacterium]
MAKNKHTAQSGAKKTSKKKDVITQEPSPATADSIETTRLAKPVFTEEAIAAQAPLPSSWSLLRGSCTLLKENWQVLLGIASVYALLNLLLIQTLSSSAKLSALKRTLAQVPTHGLGHVLDGFSLYSNLLGASGNSISPVAGAYQFVLATIVSLATIWSLRQIYGGYTIHIRDGFYRGMYPLVPFLLVLLMVVLQLVPFIVGGSIFSIISANGIAINGAEQSMFLVIFFGLGLISLYMLTSSLFALYIVSLPEMTPMAALRTARDLVAHRRWTIMRKLLFLPFALLVLSAILLAPVATFATFIAPWVFTALATMTLVFIHIYMYRLYRSLL